MAVSNGGHAVNGANVCKRCGAEHAVYTARRDILCKDCFVRFVNTKIIKRMEAQNYRVRDSTRNQKRRLLLPISGGMSSVVLLHVLDGHLEGQISRMGRSAFDIVVMFVDDGGLEKAEIESYMTRLKGRYPRHEYAVKVQSDIETDYHDGGTLEQTPGLDVMNLLKTLQTPTSRSDIATTALTHAILEEAQTRSCEGVLWGDTTTRLAEKILASTALGRGSMLPWLVNDGPSPYSLPGSGDPIQFLYFMKEVLRKELAPYNTIFNLPVLPREGVLTGAVVSSKNATIDGLMKEYFESVEIDYPSIVANVVRTSSKLQAPALSDVTQPTWRYCELCRVPITGTGSGIHGWGGDQGFSDSDEAECDLSEAPIPADPVAATQPQLCYGCARSTLPVS